MPSSRRSYTGKQGQEVKKLKNKIKRRVCKNLDDYPSRHAAQLDAGRDLSQEGKRFNQDSTNFRTAGDDLWKEVGKCNAKSSKHRSPSRGRHQVYRPAKSGRGRSKSKKSSSSKKSKSSSRSSSRGKSSKKRSPSQKKKTTKKRSGSKKRSPSKSPRPQVRRVGVLRLGSGRKGPAISANAVGLNEKMRGQDGEMWKTVEITNSRGTTYQKWERV